MGTDEFRPGSEHAATLGNAVARSDPVLRTDLAPYGFLVAARFGGVRATGPESATRRGVHGRRHVAFQDHAFALELDVGVGDGDRGEQGLGVWVQRVAVELLAGRHLYHCAEVHNPHTVGDVLDHREVVGDEQVGQVPLPLELLHQVDDLRLDRDVKCRDGLVGHDKIRVDSEGPGNPDPLPLAARELVWVAVSVFPTKAHRLEQLVHPVQALLLAFGQTMYVYTLGNDVADDHARVQGGLGVLEDHLHLAVERLALIALRLVDVLALEEHLAARRLVEPDQHPSCGRLATTGLADQTERLALVDLQLDSVDRLQVLTAYPEVLLEVFDLE